MNKRSLLSCLLLVGLTTALLAEHGEQEYVPDGDPIYATSAIAPYKAGRVCVTQKKDGTLYAIYLAREGQSSPPAEIRFPALQPDARAEMVMLGTQTKLTWSKAGQGFRVTIPVALRDNPPCRNAWTIRVSAPAD